MSESVSHYDCLSQAEIGEGGGENVVVQQEEEYVDNQFLFKETKSVVCLRITVILMLVTAASVVAGLTYWYVNDVERESFETQYSESVIKVAEGFNHGVNMKVWSASTFSAIYTSRYSEANTWPNATMAHFQEQAEGELLLSGARALSFNPIITQETRGGWENHAVGNADILGSESLVVRMDNTSWVVADGIFRFDEDDKQIYDPGTSMESRFPYVMVPVWQIAPILNNEKAVMFNLHSETNQQRALDDMMYYKVPAMTAILQLVQDTEVRPSSILFFPVFDNFDKNKVVGSISVSFSWDVILSSLLPNYIKGIICVLESNVGQAYTYKISGGQADFIGEGDLHDSGYDGMVEEVDVSVADANEMLGGVDNLITYKLRIYPSSEFESQYVTNKPLIFTLIVLAIFLCTSLTFLSYDYIIKNHQNVLMKAATNSSKIVQSLFPATVRDRLFVMNEEPKPKKRRTILRKYSSMTSMIRSLPEPVAKVVETPAVRMRNFLNVGGDASVGEGLPMAVESEPIADLFPSTTIMFADIAGFTSWSSAHQPQEVFRLLESLFKEFDLSARKLGVFKVETIGDCYVAAAGLPDAREDHAVVMAQFALECQRKMNLVKTELGGPNGLGTESLQLRSGLHSGPVTAGVLRGEKSRFQLFGDTMNTASRMESTGEPTRVQISQTTADLLREAGKESWFVEREGGVAAKGKGQMQTYWLYPNVHLKKQKKAASSNSLTATVSNFAISEVTISKRKSSKKFKIEYGEHDETGKKEDKSSINRRSQKEIKELQRRRSQRSLERKRSQSSLERRRSQSSLERRRSQSSLESQQSFTLSRSSKVKEEIKELQERRRSYSSITSEHSFTLKLLNDIVDSDTNSIDGGDNFDTQRNRRPHMDAKNPPLSGADRNHNDEKYSENGVLGNDRRNSVDSPLSTASELSIDDMNHANIQELSTPREIKHKRRARFSIDSYHGEEKKAAPDVMVKEVAEDDTNLTSVAQTTHPPLISGTTKYKPLHISSSIVDSVQQTPDVDDEINAKLLNNDDGNRNNTFKKKSLSSTSSCDDVVINTSFIDVAKKDIQRKHTYLSSKASSYRGKKKIATITNKSTKSLDAQIN